MAATAEARRRTLAAALRRAGLAEVDDSTRRRAEYSTDASLYRVVPTVVAFPRAVDEVVAALDVCRSMGVPLTSRGAGTSIAGNAVGTGLVLDFSRHLNRVDEIDPDAGTARIEPGIVLADLQRAARPYGLRFGPDPSTHNRCTLGGMIGNNACGSRALGLRPYLGQRDRARRGHRRRRAPAAHRVGGARLLADVDRVARRGRGQSRDDPYGVRPLRPPGVRLLAGAPAAGARLRRHQGARRAPRARSASCSARPSDWSARHRRPSSSRSATPTWRPPPTPYRRCCRSRRSRSRASTAGSSTSWSRSRGPAAVPDVAARQRLAVRRAGRRHRRASSPRSRRAVVRRGRRARRTRRHRSGGSGRPVAHP